MWAVEQFVGNGASRVTGAGDQWYRTRLGVEQSHSHQVFTTRTR